MDSATKYWIIKRIVECNEEAVLKQIKYLLNEGETDNWENIPLALRESIQRGIDQSNKAK